jgi:hypothetical protein
MGDCQLFQKDLDRHSNKFDPNTGKFEFPIEFVHSIDGTALERDDEIRDVEKNYLMSFLPHIEAKIMFLFVKSSFQSMGS